MGLFDAFLATEGIVVKGVSCVSFSLSGDRLPKSRVVEFRTVPLRRLARPVSGADFFGSPLIFVGLGASLMLAKLPKMSGESSDL